MAASHTFDMTRPQKLFTLAGVMLGMLLAALDQTIVSTAGPSIQRDLHIPASLYAWLTTSYLVASTVLVPVYGKLSDGFGRRRILVIGILIFLGGSALCGLSRTTVQLILARAVQGAGSASLFTSAFAIVADIFPPAERGKYQGLFGAMFGLSSVVGPLVGGFLTDHLSWHWVFFVNLPLGAVALVFILTRMPPLRRPGARPSVDVGGAFTLALFTVPLLVALSLGRSTSTRDAVGYAWGSPPILGLLAVSGVGLIAFLLVERSVREPLVDLSLFRNRVFAVGNLAAFLNGGVFLGAIVFLPLFMVNVVGLSATRSGFTLTPLTLGVVTGNVVSGQLVSRWGRYKPLMQIAQVVLMTGFGIMAFTLSPDSTQGELTLKMILVGLGLGPSIPLFTLAIQNGVAPHQMGVATASATFFRQMGSTMGVALLGTVFGGVLASSMATHMAEATRNVPAEWRREFAPPSDAGGQAGGEGLVGGRMFDAAALKARLAVDFDRRREALTRAAGEGDAQARGQLEGLARARESVESAVGQVARAFKTAFTEAIRLVYLVTLLLAALVFLVVLALPELPLRKSNAPPPAALE
ncbi:drug resistance transporter EmrB/QacA family [Cystobacter fuscus]|uniref:Drug resistance transporter EmrB/QacA family n=1 Tax=Cystobacter fuscus TaxID=43 RepID=A0A250JHC2_9BACT|nr:MDR family MFS transporter [Cystobacter fuscus]ATB42887.1 drug resistance transporter EmrB/QacA family [Cystobacter fuscus]